jgi:hypothetical protein
MHDSAASHVAPSRAVAPFEVIDWHTTPVEAPGPGPRLLRVRIDRTFCGDLVGTSTGEMVVCLADDGEPDLGGFVMSERVTACLGGRHGSFVVQHLGDNGTGVSRGHIVPGSGTGELAGIAGSVEIGIDATTGARTLVLTYDISCPERRSA